MGGFELTFLPALLRLGGVSVALLASDTILIGEVLSRDAHCAGTNPETLSVARPEWILISGGVLRTRCGDGDPVSQRSRQRILKLEVNAVLVTEAGRTRQRICNARGHEHDLSATVTERQSCSSLNFVDLQGESDMFSAPPVNTTSASPSLIS